jgi:hypothetical protein
MWRGSWAVVAAAGAFTLGICLAGAGAALVEGKDEKHRLKACEASLCQLVARKAPATGDFTCSLQKTWVKEKIEEGASAGRVSWGFGDARCKVDVKVPRAQMIDALKAADYTLQLPEHTVTCEIEREKELTPVRLRFAPKIIFKNGAAKTAWINLKDVDGPSTIKGLALTVAKLQDGVGLFHKNLIKAINDQIGSKCAKLAAGR